MGLSVGPSTPARAKGKSIALSPQQQALQAAYAAIQTSVNDGDRWVTLSWLLSWRLVLDRLKAGNLYGTSSSGMCDEPVCACQPVLQLVTKVHDRLDGGLTGSYSLHAYAT